MDYFQRISELSESANYLEDYDSSSDENILSQCLSTLKNWFEYSEKGFNQDESEGVSFFGQRRMPVDPNKCAVKPTESRQLRTRRNIDPIENLEDFSLPAIHSKRDYVRVKRTAQAQLRSLKQQYTRCNREAGQHCDDIYNRYNILVKEVNEKLQNFAIDFKFQDADDGFASDDHHIDKKKEKSRVLFQNGHTAQITEMQTVGPVIPSPIPEPATSLEPRPNKPDKFDWQEVKVIAGETKSTAAVPLIPSFLSSTVAHESTSQPDRVKLLVAHDPILPSVELVKQKGDQFTPRVGQTYFGDGFYYTYQGDQKIHEDLIDDHHEMFRNYQDLYQRLQGKTTQKSQFQTDSQHISDKSSVNVTPLQPQNAPFGKCIHHGFY